MIPLPTTDYLTSPTMFGAISPTTARIMSETGAALSKTIEANNAKLEAQAKAPEMARMMADGLSAVTAGHMEGFQTLAQAQALGASNPFLAKMADDAIRNGTAMAKTYMDNQMADARLKNQLDIETQRTTRQENTERSRYNLEDLRERNRDQKSDDTTKRILWTQAEESLSQYDQYQAAEAKAKNAELQSNYDKAMAAYREDLAGNERRVARGLPPIDIKEPVKPAEVKPPPPKSKAWGGPGPNLPMPGTSTSAITPPENTGFSFGAGPGGLFGEPIAGAPSIPLSSQAVAAAGPPPPTGVEAPLPGIGAIEGPLPVKDVTPPVATPPPAAAPVPPAAPVVVSPKVQPSPAQAIAGVVNPPLGNENEAPVAAGVESTPPKPAGQQEVEIGDTVFKFVPPPQKTQKVTEEIKVGNSSVKIEDVEPESRKLWSTVMEEGPKIDEGFARWASRMERKGDKIIWGAKSDKGIYHPATISGERYGYNTDEVTGNESKVVFNQVDVDEDTKKAFQTVRGNLEQLKNQGLEVSHNEPTYTPAERATFRSRALQHFQDSIKTNPEAIKEETKAFNNVAMQYGFNGISKDEIGRIKNPEKAPPKPVTNTEINDTLKQAGLSPMSDAQIADAMRGPLQVVGEMLSSFKKAMTMEKPEQKKLFQTQVERYTKKLADPRQSAVSKLQNVAMIQKYMRLIEEIDNKEAAANQPPIAKGL